ncbi:uncharacterized protein LOC144446821 [Glandiceps talaboti]
MANDNSTTTSKDHSETRSKSDDYEVAVILAETSSTYDGKFISNPLDEEVSESGSSDIGYSSSSPTPSEDGSDCTNDGRRTRRKRARTAFSNDQVLKLEKMFREQKYLSTTEREEFAEKIGLSDIQIKTWFQNRRMKWKRQRKDDSHSEADPDTQVSPLSYFNSMHTSPLRTSHSTVYPPRVMTTSSQPQPMTTVRLQPTPSYTMMPMSYPTTAVPLPYHSISPMNATYIPKLPTYRPVTYNYGGYPVSASPYGQVHGHYNFTHCYYR